jgi:GAF domain-containing protein
MKTAAQRATALRIWGMVAVFAVFHVVLWLSGVPPSPLHLASAWIVIIMLAVLATRGIGTLSDTLVQAEDAHRAAKSEVEQLRTQNAMLQVIARSVDVPLAFQTLAQRVAPLVPCDRVGLALLTESGDEFQTYTARVLDEERRSRPRPEVVFKADRTAIGHAVRTREPILINDTREATTDYLDVNVLHTSGFGSALIVPLVARGRAVGTLNVVARRANAFSQVHLDALLPIAEMFAVAHVAQQLLVAVAKHRTVETMTELTLGISNEINGALQIIIGHCDLLERGYPDPNLQRDLAVVVRQAQRILSLLEKMRSSSHERLREAAETVNQGIPSSPEGFGG